MGCQAHYIDPYINLFKIQNQRWSGKKERSVCFFFFFFLEFRERSLKVKSVNYGFTAKNGDVTVNIPGPTTAKNGDVTVNITRCGPVAWQEDE